MIQFDINKPNITGWVMLFLYIMTPILLCVYSCKEDNHAQHTDSTFKLTEEEYNNYLKAKGDTFSNGLINYIPESMDTIILDSVIIKIIK